MHKVTVATLLPFFLALTLIPAWADPAPAPSNRLTDRQTELIQIIQDARDEALKTHSYKNARMGMQIRIQNYYNKSHEFDDFQGKIVGTRVFPNNDVWIDIELADGITVQTSPTIEDDPEHVTLLKGGTKLADIAATLKSGDRVRFNATLVRFVNDKDEDMINASRMLAQFKTITPLK